MEFPLCPECRGPLEGARSACPHCGYPLVIEPSRAAANGAASPPIVRELSPLQQIAYRQKLFLYGLALGYTSTFPLGLLAKSVSPDTLSVAWAPCMLVLTILAWCSYQLSRALGFWIPVAFCFAALQFIPSGPFLSLLFLNGMATRRLWKAKVRVGMLGADLKTVP